MYLALSSSVHEVLFWQSAYQHTAHSCGSHLTGQAQANFAAMIRVRLCENVVAGSMTTWLMV